MATATPVKKITAEKKVFDLDTKDDVILRKSGEFVPVSTMAEFTERLGNNANLILELANKALEVHAESELANSDAPWLAVSKNDDDEEILVPFTGAAISEAAATLLSKNVIGHATMLYDYAKVMVPGDAKANRDAKNAAKDKAREDLLGNPAIVAKLKSMK